MYLVAVSTDKKTEEVMYYLWGTCKSLMKMIVCEMSQFRNLYFLPACLTLTTPVKREKIYSYIHKGLKPNGIY